MEFEPKPQAKPEAPKVEIGMVAKEIAELNRILNESENNRLGNDEGDEQIIGNDPKGVVIGLIESALEGENRNVLKKNAPRLETIIDNLIRKRVITPTEANPFYHQIDGLRLDDLHERINHQ